MRLHGGYPPPRLSAADPPSRKSGPDRHPAIATRSARRILRSFRGCGLATSDEAREIARLLEAVACRLGHPYARQQMLARDIDIRANPDLPSGYTYLAQFAAHEIGLLQPTHPPIPPRPTNDPNLR